MRSIKNALYKLIAEQKIAPKDAMLIFKELQGNDKYIDDDIAIIGMAGRMPGADNPDEYWSKLRDSVNCITELPGDRKKDIECIFTEEQKRNAVYRSGGYIKDVDKFDAAFFRIPPKEAEYMEPEQRLFLEVVWEAVEDAGYANAVYGTKTGIYAGHDHVAGAVYRNYTGGLENEDTLALTGTYPSILSSRISYILDLKGPNIVFDTACSSGLIALHEACKALRGKECDMAIAGGISLQLWPVKLKSFKMVETNSDTVRTFDKNSSGTVWGEGVCAFMLKPLSKALEDRDNIHAVIKGSAINNDGVSSGITAPNAEAQESVIMKAMEESKVDPETLTYIETHGTGTVMGDPLEVKALKNAFSRYTNKKQFCGIGSLKPSIGHLISASGTASLMKVILSMKNREIPATINFLEPNPYINFCDSQFYLNDRLRKWDTAGSPIRAGISSFGFSGTNCHMIIEEAPEMERKVADSNGRLCVLTLSAKRKEILNDIVKRYLAFLAKEPQANLEDICFTANTGRCHFGYRLAITVVSKNELKEKLELICDSDFEEVDYDGVFYGVHKVVNKHRDNRVESEITEGEKEQLSRESNAQIKALLEAGEEYQNILETLCNYYISGAEIEWNKLIYIAGDNKRVSIPVYPFEKVRYWYLPEKEKSREIISNTESKCQMGVKIHPLLGYCISETISNSTYWNELRDENSWILTDHKLLGESVIPGTAYLEMAYKACSRILKTNKLKFLDFTFLAPLFVNKGENKEIYSVINNNGDYLEVTICSKFDEKWIKHAIGKVLELEEKEADSYDIEKIMTRCPKEVQKEEIKDKTSIAEFGKRWGNIAQTLIGDNEILACIELPSEISDDLKEYVIHPAMLDNAVNMVIRLNEKNDYLPLMYKSLKVYRNMPRKFYSHIVKKGIQNSQSETISYDITLIDESGALFAEIENYTIKKVHERDFRTDKLNVYYGTEWVECKPKIKSPGMDRGPMLVFMDECGIGERFIKEQQDKGIKISRVTQGQTNQKVDDYSYIIDGSPESYVYLLEEFKEESKLDVIYLQAITENNDVESVNQLVEGRRKGADGLFYLAKALLANRLSNGIRILAVVDNASEVTGNERYIKPHNAALFGVAKVISLENPNIRCTCVDIDDNSGAMEIASELEAEDQLYNIAYRQGKRYIEEFKKTDIDEIQDKKIDIIDGNVYVVSGGTGGIGLEMAKYLASKARVNICVISRTKIPEREKWTIYGAEGNNRICQIIDFIKCIEATGSQIECYSADITNEHEASTVLESIRERFGKINGILHCAGMPGDGIIFRKDIEAFERVVSPKIQGTWILDKLTEKDNLDFFAMFSSIIAIMGSSGQSDYAAANSYMESYSAYRNRKGKRSVTVSWAPWKEIGMAIDNGFDAIRGPFKPISTLTAVSAWDTILNKDLNRITIGEIDNEVMGMVMDHLSIRISDGLRKNINSKNSGAVSARKVNDQNQAKNVTLKGRDNGKYSDIEKRIAKIWSKVIGANEIDVYDSFMQLGGDSIIATGLLAEIQKEFGEIVEISDVFTYPSIEQISEYLARQTDKKRYSRLTMEEIMIRLGKGEITVNEAAELKKKISIKK